MGAIRANLQAVSARIARAAQAAGRDPHTVRVLAVSKMHPAAHVDEAYHAGQIAFGENYVQEALGKMQALARLPLEWHLIGPLQSNKARLAAERFAWVQSVASERVARRLSENRSAEQAPLNVLVQVNVSGETSKSGVAPAALPALAHVVAGLPRLRLRGLMAIPEPTADIALQRARFGVARRCYDALAGEGLALDTLSLGMSDDLEAAIAEGSTMVRIGTAIFGPRGTGGAHPDGVAKTHS
ncbi:MAG: YggS family pyridoxal phosphate enzyme [Betaproteobacteria bacterium RIFCSPLOWO2_02_FULL_66_14]|nr:MAG: YggS family pyridoxal phosphate enzyme [Betaproteobacteria bacterium RIFCSPLOWO2_02_FULL_66_14]